MPCEVKGHLVVNIYGSCICMMFSMGICFLRSKRVSHIDTGIVYETAIFATLN